MQISHEMALKRLPYTERYTAPSSLLLGITEIIPFDT
jgi:hypothetical protein